MIPTAFVPRHVTMNDDHPPAPPAVATVLKLPLFWAEDPALWFAQAEAQFATRHITTELTKFRYIVAFLSPEVATEVRDILLDASPAQLYTTLRTARITRVGVTEDTRLQQLLEDEPLGDRRPSQLLRHMRQLLVSATMDDAVLRRLFLRRLPASCLALPICLLASTGSPDGLKLLLFVTSPLRQSQQLPFYTPGCPVMASHSTSFRTAAGNLNCISGVIFCPHWASCIITPRLTIFRPMAW